MAEKLRFFRPYFPEVRKLSTVKLNAQKYLNWVTTFDFKPIGQVTGKHILSETLADVPYTYLFSQFDKKSLFEN